MAIVTIESHTRTIEPRSCIHIGGLYNINRRHDLGRRSDVCERFDTEGDR